MRVAGFSTGAIAKGDFRHALEILQRSDADAVELSALRANELEPLIDALSTLALARFRYVSIHGPSQFSPEEEPRVIADLKRACSLGWSVVVHPDAMHDVNRWADLGAALCIENMDKRKSIGRSAEELQAFFAKLPQAGLCLDLAHARQVDSSMTEAYRLILYFADRIRQVHVSEVSTSSRHARMSAGAEADYRTIAELIPSDTPVIVEAPVHPREMAEELAAARRALTPLTAEPRPLG